MKTIRRSFALITAVVLAASFAWGCRHNNDVPEPTAVPIQPSGTETAAPTEQTVVTSAPVDTEAVQTPEPGPTETPAAPTEIIPDETPAPATQPPEQVVTGLVWIDGSRTLKYDLDFDGKPETVEITASSSVSVKITVGANGKVLSESVSAGRFFSVLINNFNSSDRRAEIIISTGSGNRQRNMLCLRLDSSSNALEKLNVEGKAVAADGDTLTVSRMLDVLGTWECTAAFKFASSGFKLEQQGEFWDVVRSEERWCTVSQEMLIGYYTSGLDNETGFIEPGYRMYPTRTDLNTIIDVTLDTGALGYLPITVGQNGELMYSGNPLTSWFSDLTFIN